MGQYLLSVYYVEGQEPPSPDVVEQMHRDVGTFNDSLIGTPAWVFAGGLQTPDTSRVVRDGGAVVTDGPLAQSREQLGGFWVLHADDDEAALALARRASAACRGPVDVRPFQAEPEA
jgi:hypothetical protein